MTSYLCKNEAEIQNVHVHLIQIPDVGMRYHDNLMAIEVSDGSFCCIYRTLSFELNLFFSGVPL